MSSNSLMVTVFGPLLVLALVIAFRLRRAAREKPLSGRFLWLVPTLYAAVVLYVLVRHPPDATGWALVAAGLLMGAALGWHRGHLFDLRLDPQSCTVLRRRPPAAVLLLAGVVALRFIAGGLIGSPASLERGSAAMLLTDFTLGSLFGLLTFTRLEIAWRARRLLGARRS